MLQPQFVKASIKPFLREWNRTIHFQFKRKGNHFSHPFKRQGQFLRNPCYLPADTINGRYVEQCLSYLNGAFFQRNKAHYRIQQRSLSTAGLPYDTGCFSPFQFQVKTGEKHFCSKSNTGIIDM